MIMKDHEPARTKNPSRSSWTRLFGVVFDDREGFGTASGTRSFRIMEAALAVREGVPTGGIMGFLRLSGNSVGRLAWRIWLTWRIRDPLGYQKLRRGRILHVN